MISWLTIDTWLLAGHFQLVDFAFEISNRLLVFGFAPLCFMFVFLLLNQDVLVLLFRVFAFGSGIHNLRG